MQIPPPLVDDYKEDSKDDMDGGARLVGQRIRVWWPADMKYYNGIVAAWADDESTEEDHRGKHQVVYDDGDVRWYNLSEMLLAK